MIRWFSYRMVYSDISTHSSIPYKVSMNSGFYLSSYAFNIFYFDIIWANNNEVSSLIFCRICIILCYVARSGVYSQANRKKKKHSINIGWMCIKSGVATAVILVAIIYAVIPVVLDIFPAIVFPEVSLGQLWLYTFVIFLFVLGVFYDSEANNSDGRSSVFWRIAQTFTTALLFGTWLMHDMVNIAVFLPSNFWIEIMLLISVLFLLWLAYTFYIHGWPVGNIVTKKTSTNEIVAATMIDLVYFVILLIFKDWSNIPMSTTWVFVWLLAGRQFAIRAVNRIDKIEWSGRMNLAFKESWKDFSKIMVWLWISVVALIIVRYFTGT